MGKKAAILVMILTLLGLGSWAAAERYTPPNYLAQHWNLTLNGIIRAIGADIDALFSAVSGLSALVTNWAVTEDYPILETAAVTYSSGTNFTVAGDKTSRYTGNRKIEAYCGGDGMRYSHVDSSSYGGGVTTVVLNNSVLTSNLQWVRVTVTRDGLTPGPVGWVLAQDYGSPSQATLQAAQDAIGVAQRELRAGPGNWPITSNFTLPANLVFRPQSGCRIQVATGVTVTINKLYGDLPLEQWIELTGTGKVVFAPGAVKELVPQWWGAKGDAVLGVSGTDDILALQAMVDCSVASKGIPMFVPGGVYKITDTWKLNKGVGYAGFNVRGAGSAGVSGGQGTWIDATAFGDRPGINIQGARRIVVEDLRVCGKNAAPLTASATLDPTLANWITAGCVDSQYAPYAGIAIDAYQGAKPTGGYDNDTYSRMDSSYVMLRNVGITGFVVGLGIAPCNVSLDSDAVTLQSCQISYNTYGYSCGGSQSRSIIFQNTDVYGHWCGFTTIRHGQKIGNCPSIYGGILQTTWKLFELGPANGNNAKIISGVHAESNGWLGEFGVLDSGQTPPTKFVGCQLGSSSYEPFFFIATSPVHFDSCFFAFPSKYVFNFYAPNRKIKFTQCKFAQMADTANGFFAVRDGAYYGDYEFDNCEVESIGNASSGYYLNINSELKVGIYQAARRFITPYTHTVRIFNDGAGFTSYKVTTPHSNYRTWYTLGFAGAVVTGTDHNAVLTFTATSAADWKVGDIIIWRVTDRSGNYQELFPVFRISDITGTAVTANSLFDNVDVAYTPSYLNVAIPLFINATESTGDTHGTTTVDNVTEIANWRVGDWIRGAGIDNDTRIVNIASTTITLSKGATASATGVALYNCRLTAY